MLEICDVVFLFVFFNDTATTEIYTLSLHDALPISCRGDQAVATSAARRCWKAALRVASCLTYRLSDSVHGIEDIMELHDAIDRYHSLLDADSARATIAQLEAGLRELGMLVGKQRDRLICS